MTYSDLVNTDLHWKKLSSHHLGHLGLSALMVESECRKLISWTYLDHGCLTGGVGKLTARGSLHQTGDGGGVDDLRSVAFGVVGTLLEQGQERSSRELQVLARSRGVVWNRNSRIGT